ncbi:hypothetical protein IWW37_000628 [Coemansia sp. RSA 2050]|nr:hypothetical protein IWW37_000628 [Coemansia sp. RSA 2050]KAJ2732230.1 hypothetical protein IW152_003950 [Coemansia sp. BCRC 34962]
MSITHADSSVHAACPVSLSRGDELVCDAEDDRVSRVVTREIMVTQAARDDMAGLDAVEPGHVQIPGASLHSEPVEEGAQPASGDEGEEGEEGEGAREGVAQALYPQAALFMRQCLPESAWEPDEATAVCRQCSRRFSLFLRRHHCRRCGLVFCDSCSSKRVLLGSPVSTAQSGYYAPTSAESDDNTPLFQIYAATLRGMYWRFREHRACHLCTEAVGSLPAARTSSLALVESAVGSMAIENAYNIFRSSETQATEGQRPVVTRPSSSASIRVCPVCDRDWATVWSSMGRVPGEGWQESQERHIRECIEDTAAEMQGAHRHCPQAARATRRSRSVQPHRLASDLPPPAQSAAASQPRRSAGIMGLFERTASPTSNPEADEASGTEVARSPSPPGIKYVSYKLNGDTPLLGQECAICFEDFEPGQRVARLSCLCTYHVWCISEWTLRTPTCPVHYN